MPQTRLFLVQVSPLVTRMITVQTENEPGVEIVGQADSADGLEAALAAAAADVVIWGVDAGALPRVRDVVVSDPSLKVLALEAADGAGVMVELRAELEELPDVGAVQLVAVSRRAGTRRSGLDIADLTAALASARSAREAPC